MQIESLTLSLEPGCDKPAVLYLHHRSVFHPTNSTSPSFTPLSLNVCLVVWVYFKRGRRVTLPLLRPALFQHVFNCLQQISISNHHHTVETQQDTDVSAPERSSVQQLLHTCDFKHNSVCVCVCVSISTVHNTLK